MKSVGRASASALSIASAAPLAGDQSTELAYISGVDADGRVVATSFASWTGTNPPAYASYDIDVAKWGATVAGSAATVTYSFVADARWTRTERAAITAALYLWSAEANVRFLQVATGGEIAFDRGSDGEASTASESVGIATVGSTSLDRLTHATISIDTSVAGFGPIGADFSVAGAYPWMTLLHEVGHAIGLGHAGAYNAGGDDDSSGVVTPLTVYDSRAYSLMSYLDASETVGAARPLNGFQWYAGGQELSPTTPMLLDILAAQRLYGPPTTTPLSGGQVFGFNTNIGGDVRQFFDFTVNTRPVLTLFDTGTGNTLDLSGYSTVQTVDLHQGAFSSVGGLTNNVAIAFGTRIDTVVGGFGSDILSANDDGDSLVGGAGNDTLLPGAGIDTLSGGAGQDRFEASPEAFNGDTITDLRLGDTLAFIGSFPGGFAYSLQGDVLHVGAATLALPGFAGTLQPTAAGGFAGAQLTVVRSSYFVAPSDLDGDGHSDILFQNVGGAISTWAFGGAVHGVDVRQGAFNAAVDRSWHAVETLDFDSDGLSDILYRNDNGALAVWTATSSGFNQAAYYHAPVDSGWRIAGVGDVDGDGHDDLLWQKRDGSLLDWNALGAAFNENSYQHASPGSGWLVEGLGDFNGDGKVDILWRNADGSVALWTNATNYTITFNEGAFYQPQVATSWHVDGIGDFDGDGRDDIVWRNDDGLLSVWRSVAGGFAQNVYSTRVATSWHVAAIDDFNADHRADILWRNDSGALSTWESNGAGFDQAIYNSSADPSWHIVAHDFVL